MNKLHQAAKNVPGHWLKGIYGDGNGNFCLAGHIYNVCGIPVDVMNGGAHHDNKEAKALMQLVGTAIREAYPERATWIADFNDRPTTTEDEIVAVLEKAAVRLDETVED